MLPRPRLFPLQATHLFSVPGAHSRSGKAGTRPAWRGHLTNREAMEERAPDAVAPAAVLLHTWRLSPIRSSDRWLQRPALSTGNNNEIAKGHPSKMIEVCPL